MLSPPLSCTVRGCGLPLERREAVWQCAAGHSFDIARLGYVNLLQPQDRKAHLPGDSKGAVEARAVLRAAGVGRTLGETVGRLLDNLNLLEGAVLVDLGSGTGDVLGALASTRKLQAIGIDLSTSAVEHAARRFRSVTWVVANADRRLPLLEQSVDVVLSLHARRHPEECARVLKPAGRLIVAVPAPDDLIELRTAVQGAGMERDRLEALVAEHAPWWTVVQRVTVRDVHTLHPPQVRALLAATYRGARTSVGARVAALGAMSVTMASDLVVMTRASGVGGGRTVEQPAARAAQ